MMERQTGGAWASKSPAGRRGREGRGWAGATSQTGQDSRRGHRHVSRFPRGQARGSVFAQSLGASSKCWELPARSWDGQAGTWGGRGTSQTVLSCKANPALVGSAVLGMCVSGRGCPTHPLPPSHSSPHTFTPTSTGGVTPAPEAHGKGLPRLCSLQGLGPPAP